jgi:hypothetical protein
MENRINERRNTMKHIKITSKLRPALAADNPAADDGTVIDRIREALGKEPKE